MRILILGALFLTLVGSAAARAEESGDAAGGANTLESQLDRDQASPAAAPGDAVPTDATSRDATSRDPASPDPASLDSTEVASTVGSALAEALQAKNATRIELTIRCEQYVLALTVFDDGSFKATDMQDELVDKAALASAEAALPMLTVIDTGCPED